jgi:hypothetical protein
MSVFKLIFTQTVIPRLDTPVKSEDGIQCIQYVLEPRVKPEDDNPLSYGQNLYRPVQGIR